LCDVRVGHLRGLLDRLPVRNWARRLEDGPVTLISASPAAQLRAAAAHSLFERVGRVGDVPLLLQTFSLAVL
jgi:hypothetical protein